MILLDFGNANSKRVTTHVLQLCLAYVVEDLGQPNAMFRTAIVIKG